jgi:hypothetical protein
LPRHWRAQKNRAKSHRRMENRHVASEKHAASVIICLFNLALASWSAWRVAAVGL